MSIKLSGFVKRKPLKGKPFEQTKPIRPSPAIPARPGTPDHLPQLVHCVAPDLEETAEAQLGFSKEREGNNEHYNELLPFYIQYTFAESKCLKIYLLVQFFIWKASLLRVFIATAWLPWTTPPRERSSFRLPLHCRSIPWHRCWRPCPSKRTGPSPAAPGPALCLEVRNPEKWILERQQTYVDVRISILVCII